MIIDMLLSRNIRRCNIKTVAGITILALFLLAGSAGAYTPPAILKIDGNEQTSGIGSKLLEGREPDKLSLCGYRRMRNSN